MKDLFYSLEVDLFKKVDFLELKEHLVDWEKSGITKEEAITQLETLLTKTENESDIRNQVLDLLDIAEGWCQQKYKIWWQLIINSQRKIRVVFKM